MPGTVIGKQLNLGYPGTFSRNGDIVISNRAVSLTATEEIKFGELVQLNADNTVRKLPAGLTAATGFLGIAVRIVKQELVYGQNFGSYKPGEPCDVLERGSVVVTLAGGTPTAGGQVYFNATTRAITATATDVALPNVRFTSGQVDANNTVEITVLTRK